MTSQPNQPVQVGLLTKEGPERGGTPARAGITELAPLMQDQATTAGDEGSARLAEAQPKAARSVLRHRALTSALLKRQSGVPTYSVPEAAALMSISQEYLYRLIQADGFPALRMQRGGGQGRYVVPAKAVEMILDHVAHAGGCVDIGELAADWQAIRPGGAA